MLQPEYGLLLVSAFKKLIKDKGLAVEIGTQQASCMNTYELGRAVVVYPWGFFMVKRLNDIEEISLSTCRQTR